MGTLVRSLSALFVIQLVLFFVLAGSKDQLGTFEASEALLSFKSDEINTVTLQDSEKKTITLKKNENNWVLPTHYSFPASKEKIADFFEDLEDIEKTWPVATTKQAWKQLQLQPDNFERKITLQKGESSIETLFLGTSPGFKKVHARVDGENASYSIPFSAQRASISEKDWQDANYLKVNRKDITEIAMNGLTLQNKDNAFIISDLDEANEEMITTEVNSLLEQFTGLNFEEILGTEAADEYQESSPELTATIKLQSGETRTYQFLANKDDSYRTAKIEEKPFYLKIFPGTVDRLKQFTREGLVKAKVEEIEEEQAKDSPEEENQTTEQ